MLGPGAYLFGEEERKELSVKLTAKDIEWKLTKKLSKPANTKGI